MHELKETSVLFFFCKICSLLDICINDIYLDIYYHFVMCGGRSRFLLPNSAVNTYCTRRKISCIDIHDENMSMIKLGLTHIFKGLFKDFINANNNYNDTLY